MSHITEIKTRYLEENLDALAAVVAPLGGALRRGQTTFRTYGRFVGDSAEGQAFVDSRGAEAIGKCTHAIVLNDTRTGDYEVGLVPALDGPGFNLVYDAWGPGQRLEQAFGPGLTTIRREYAASVAGAKAVATLSRHGFRMTRETLPGNRIKLRLRRG